MTGWGSLDEELRRWREAEREPTLWWRDDDAVDASEPLERLLDLCACYSVPIGLAVIPRGARSGLARVLSGTGASVLQHGVSHANRAPAGARTSEFPAGTDVEAALVEIGDARDALADLLAPWTQPVFVPPWNRIDDRLARRLTASLFAAVSGFGAQPLDAAPGFVNTHLDVIDWRGTRGFVGERRALEQLTDHLAARRGGTARAGEVTGVLTHHLVHDRQTWAFLRDLCEWVRAHASVRWLSVPEVLASAGAGTAIAPSVGGGPGVGR